MPTARTVLVNASGVRSGAENVLANVAAMLVAEGAEVVLVCPPGPAVEAMPAGVRHVPIRRLGLSGGGVVARIVGLARLLISWSGAARALRSVVGSGDRIVVNSLFALPVLLLAYPRGRGAMTTWLVHDTVVSRKQRVAVRLGARSLDRAVAVSEVTAESVRPLVPDVVVRVNGVRVPDPSAGGRERREVGLVGILALITEWKGQDVLLEAVSRVPSARLEIAGTAPSGDDRYEEALRSRSAKPDLAGRVRFLGHVDRSEVLSRWSVAVSASVLPEAGPLGVLECMAAGLPVIATDHGGAAEYLAGGAGVLVPPGDAAALADALEGLLTDVDRREAIARTARRRIEERHDLEITLPAMVRALTTP